jgi:hypothetical protein
MQNSKFRNCKTFLILGRWWFGEMFRFERKTIGNTFPEGQKSKTLGTAAEPLSTVPSR